MRSRHKLTAVLLAAMTALSACTDTVFRDRDPFNPPPDAVSGFLGYFDADEQQTTCGNCHVDHQNDWSGSAHAGAFATLAANPGVQDFCEGCHTVNERGNDFTGAAGWNAVEDEAYHDVQCESCHGPGLEHVETPDASAPPLARVSLNDSLTGCGSCHTGEHHPYVEEWAASRHGAPNAEVIESYVEDPAGEATCMPCHEGRSTLRAWGVSDNYAERDQAITATAAFGVQCAVCHDPHGSENAGQLRFPVDDPSLDNNLCMKCHARRFEPALTSSRGPHAPQGPVVLGTAGYWPPGYDTTAIVATHGNPSANPRYCAGCHVNKLTITDAGGNFTFQSVGHLFRPIPCLDPVTGRPVADNSCAYTTTARSFAGCAAAGCHASVNEAKNAFDANRATLAVLADLVWVDVNGNGNVDAGDTGYLSQVPPTEFSTSDGRLTIAEGALFNIRMVGEGRYANGDKSFGVHNPFLSQSILSASINALQDTYGLLRAPPEAQRIVDEALRNVRRTPVAVSRN